MSERVLYGIMHDDDVLLGWDLDEVLEGFEKWPAEHERSLDAAAEPPAARGKGFAGVLHDAKIYDVHARWTDACHRARQADLHVASAPRLRAVARRLVAPIVVAPIVVAPATPPARCTTCGGDYFGACPRHLRLGRCCSCAGRAHARAGNDPCEAAPSYLINTTSPPIPPGELAHDIRLPSRPIAA